MGIGGINFRDKRASLRPRRNRSANGLRFPKVAHENDTFGNFIAARKLDTPRSRAAMTAAIARER